MKVLTLKTLPDGTPAGQVIDLDPDVVAILALAGVDAVRAATDEDDVLTPVRRRSGYIRRDLRAS